MALPVYHVEFQGAPYTATLLGAGYYSIGLRPGYSVVVAQTHTDLIVFGDTALVATQRTADTQRYASACKQYPPGNPASLARFGPKPE